VIHHSYAQCPLCSDTIAWHNSVARRDQNWHQYYAVGFNSPCLQFGTLDYG